MSLGSELGQQCLHSRAHIPGVVYDKIVRKVTKLRGHSRIHIRQGCYISLFFRLGRVKEVPKLFEEPLSSDAALVF